MQRIVVDRFSTHEDREMPVEGYWKPRAIRMRVSVIAFDSGGSLTQFIRIVCNAKVVPGINYCPETHVVVAT